MARHSHWHNIQLKKGKADAKRAGAFAKIAKNITVAAKDGGGDPAFNFKLRVAVDAAKAVSMPKDNIQRAIDRGTGGGEGAQLEEVVYEGFAPGGVAMLVVCLTDNRNRSVAEVKTAASKNGGSIGAAGSVMWMFEKKGIVVIADATQINDRDAFELGVIDAGAEDVRSSDEAVEIVCAVKDLQKVVEAIEKLGVKADGASIEYMAKNTVAVEEANRQALDACIEAIEDLDDVDAVYTNEA
jgi:YebC/PmpR family DNA-binding regulatory protein